jgi:hypothetical protein
MSVTGVESTVKEPNVPDIDQQVRTLFTDAAGDVPPGIDLLHGFGARRVRGRVALAAAAGSLLAAVTAVTLTIATAPSALAQLTSAASRTAGLSYDFSATLAFVPLEAGGSAPPSRAASPGRLTQRRELARRRPAAAGRSGSSAGTSTCRPAGSQGRRFPAASPGCGFRARSCGTP